MQFIVIGITDNPQPWFPPEVLEIIRNGKVFSGGKRHHEIVAPLLPADAQWIDITVPLDDVFAQYSSLFTLHSSLSLIVFASGDPLFFGFANTIKRKMPKAEIVVYPTFNSLQMLAHRLVMPYHDMRIVSLTGRPWHEFDKALIERVDKIGILTDREHTPAAIAQRMLDYGYTYYNMSVGEHLGNPSLEKVSILTLEEATHRDFSMPNCVIVKQGDGSFVTSHGVTKEPSPCFIAGSSWPPDEEIFIKYFNQHKDWKLIIAPHVIGEDHLKQIEKLLEGRRVIRYSEYSDNSENSDQLQNAEVLIVNCFGLLSSIYHYGDIAYVGGGFGVGIHNLLEAAVWDVPVFFGPNNERFQEAQELKKSGGFEITCYEDFERQMDRFLADEDYLKAQGQLAGHFVKGQAGATQEVLSSITL